MRRIISLICVCTALGPAKYREHTVACSWGRSNGIRMENFARDSSDGTDFVQIECKLRIRGDFTHRTGLLRAPMSPDKIKTRRLQSLARDVTSMFENQGSADVTIATRTEPLSAHKFLLQGMMSIT